LLGDRLEEKTPPGDADAAAQWYAQTGQKDRDARALSQELYAAGTELLKDKLAPKALGRALRYASTGLGPAVHRTSLARAPLSRGASGRDGSARTFGAALQAEIREEEKDVLYLEDLLDRSRLDAMQELGKELAASLREAADQLKEMQAKEQELEKKTAQLRKEMQSQARKKFEQKGGAQLAKELRQKAELARKAIAQIDPRVAEHLGLEDTLDMAQGRASDLSRALDGNDFDEALDLAERSARAVEAR